MSSFQTEKQVFKIRVHFNRENYQIELFIEPKSWYFCYLLIPINALLANVCFRFEDILPSVRGTLSRLPVQELILEYNDE